MSEESKTYIAAAIDDALRRNEPAGPYVMSWNEPGGTRANYPFEITECGKSARCDVFDITVTR